MSEFSIERVGVGSAVIEAWIASTFFEQAQGFMHATPAQVAPLPDGTPRGMLFVFASERQLSFFMRDTIIPLDLAYATADGTIVEIHALTPLNETPVTSAQPVQFALEAPAGTFAQEGIEAGKKITRPN